MEIRTLLKNVQVIGENIDMDITGITFDTRNIEKNNLFFCIRGLKTDGHNLAKTALEKGAGATCVRKRLGPGASDLVLDTRAALAVCAANWFGNPQDDLKLHRCHGDKRKNHGNVSYATYSMAPVIKQASSAPLKQRSENSIFRQNTLRPTRHIVWAAGRDARRGLQSCGDGGVVTRAGTASCGGVPVCGGCFHQLDAGPPRLPRQYGKLLRSQAPLVFTKRHRYTQHRRSIREEWRAIFPVL
jgi:hypothetical protein